MEADSPASSAGPWRVIVDALPLIVAAVALYLWLQPPEAVIEPVKLEPVSAHSSDSLAEVFQARDYNWPAQSGVPPIAVQSFPHDLDEQRVARKKRLFFQSLLPLVLAENHRVERERQLLTQAFERGNPNNDPEARRIAARYQVGGDLSDPENQETLFRRVLPVPPALALAQAAHESAWGTSRFAREGNNLFGQWTWDASQGLVPKRRAEDATHYVRRFESLRRSVRGYLLNLNTHGAYAALRSLRERIHRNGLEPSGLRMAGGLTAYSERGAAYVEDIREMIRGNDLTAINAARLRE